MHPMENEDLQTALSSDEKKEKMILELSYLKTKFENKIKENPDKDFKQILKEFKNFEKNLETFLESKISKKEKNLYYELKESNFDSTVLKLTKFI